MTSNLKLGGQKHPSRGSNCSLGQKENAYRDPAISTPMNVSAGQEPHLSPDGKSLMPVMQNATTDHVLNGIAFDAQGNRIFVTGKNWPSIFEIRVKPTTSTQ